MDSTNGGVPFWNDLGIYPGASPFIQWAILIVAGLIVIVGIFSVGVSIWLSVKYIKFNRRENSKGLLGSEAAREILDKNGLQHIKVSVVGSFIFGNSYSHYFKKVRIRRRTEKKASITSLAMGAQKSCLALLDKEGDKDMKTRIILTPLMYFGPFAFIPIILIGVVLDLFIFYSNGITTIISAGLSLLVYIISFVLSIMTLKTEVKAQKRCYSVLKENDMATDEEIEMMKELFKLYNIQYVNDLILELLQMILKILEIIAKVQSSSSSSD